MAFIAYFLLAISFLPAPLQVLVLVFFAVIAFLIVFKIVAFVLDCIPFF